MTWRTTSRKDQLRAAGTTGWKEQAAAKRIMRRYAGICHVCGQLGADEVDHVINLAVTGPAGDEDWNKRPIHKVPCHAEKTKAETQASRRPRRRPAEPHPGLTA